MSRIALTLLSIAFRAGSCEIDIFDDWNSTERRGGYSPPNRLDHGQGRVFPAPTRSVLFIVMKMTIFKGKFDQPADKSQRRREQNQDRCIDRRRDFIRVFGVGYA